MFADLHIHTRYSDGTYTPEELVSAAQRHGLAALSVTDHDTVEACAPVAQLCAAARLEFISGVELTAEWAGQEMHVLGYGVDVENPVLLNALAQFQEVRQNRVREIVARLNKLNIPLRAETVFALANCLSPGRPHVSRALVQAGYCADQEEAFDRFLKKHRPAWVPKFKLSARECFRLVHQAGGLASLAHPALNHVDALVPDLVAAGLDGIECFHTKHSPEVSAYYLRMAGEHNLLVTGGSDCHGMSKGRPTLGGVKLPYAWFDRVVARLSQNRLSQVGPTFCHATESETN